ncbi:pyridoxal phosphate-dependent aminotransferase [Amnibacterium flavum]|uniref:pyridoxal phosphate-dependent aminotransferase n=1 Tax=Amnibacterium flavum TaxID=2173173 RepID=UPI001403F59F|nr:aminotransferase class I/II-fold pyridoxal phosphate-dependent enzyme [Amnibacterium flavum]
MPHLAPHIDHLGASGIREIVNLVLASDRDIARLEVGEPGFPTPDHIVEAAVRAARSGIGYTHSAGMQALREAIAESVERRYGTAVPFDRVIVCQGAGQGISAVLSAVLSTGDEVLVPDPSWPNYAMLTVLHGARPVFYGLRPENGFAPDLAELESLVTERTRVIILNSPGNPTGAVLPRDVIGKIVAFAADRGILVISDEVYDELIFDGEPADAAGFGTDNVVSAFSFSKTYAMTGWRVGYVIAPEWLAPTLVHVQEPLLSCISGVSQMAAIAALQGPQAPVAAMRDAYRAHRDLAVSLLEPTIPVVRPEGAFYLMIPLAPGVDSRTAALELVEYGVAVAPGSAFGQVAADHVRISLASGTDVLRTGIERFLTWHDVTEAGLRPAIAASTAVH